MLNGQGGETSGGAGQGAVAGARSTTAIADTHAQTYTPCRQKGRAPPRDEERVGTGQMGWRRWLLRWGTPSLWMRLC